jgi:hypothetical protein
MPVALQEKLPCSTLFASSPSVIFGTAGICLTLAVQPPRLDHRHG